MPVDHRLGALVPAAVVGALLLAVAAWWLLRDRVHSPRAAAASGISAIAVLPFREVGTSPDSSYLGDGMTEGLVADLAEIGSLKVIARSSGAMAQGTTLPLAGRARELGVHALVEGSIRRTGDSVRTSVRLVRAADSALLLDRSWAGRLGELPNLQREIAAAITGSIGARIGEGERSRLQARREVDQRAYDAYLRGRFHLERGEMEQAKPPSSRRAASRRIGHRRSSAWRITTPRCRSSATRPRRWCCRRPGPR